MYELTYLFLTIIIVQYLILCRSGHLLLLRLNILNGFIVTIDILLHNPTLITIRIFSRILAPSLQVRILHTTFPNDTFFISIYGGLLAC